RVSPDCADVIDVGKLWYEIKVFVGNDVVVNQSSKFASRRPDQLIDSVILEAVFRLHHRILEIVGLLGIIADLCNVAGGVKGEMQILQRLRSRITSRPVSEEVRQTERPGVVKIASKDLVAVVRKLTLALRVVVLIFQKLDESALASNLSFQRSEKIGFVVRWHDHCAITERDLSGSIQRIVLSTDAEDLGVQHWSGGDLKSFEVSLACQCFPVEIIFVVRG